MLKYFPTLGTKSVPYGNPRIWNQYDLNEVDTLESYRGKDMERRRRTLTDQ